MVLGKRQEAEEGYVAAGEYSDLLGKEAVTYSVLRPSGIIEIEGRRIDAVSDGTWIPAGQRVEVVSVQGSRIVVGRSGKRRRRGMPEIFLTGILFLAIVFVFVLFSFIPIGLWDFSSGRGCESWSRDAYRDAFAPCGAVAHHFAL